MAKHIHIITENFSFSRLMRHFLEQQQYWVSAATSAANNASTAAAHNPDLVLVDLPHRPDADIGLTDLRGQWPDTKCILLADEHPTANRLSFQVTDALDPGRTLAKPFATEDLLVAIEEVLAAH